MTDPPSANIFDGRHEPDYASSASALSEDDFPRTRTKKKKTVTIQTPPHSPELAHSPEQPGRRLSASDSATRAASPPPPARDPRDVDVVDSEPMAKSDSDLWQATINARRNSGALSPPNPQDTAPMRAPYNPFARTLATTEAELGTPTNRIEQEDEVITEQRKPALGIDAFKNILMGEAPLPPGLSMPSTGRPNDSSSSTDTSSIFDPGYGFHPESPRASFDGYESASESEDELQNERAGLMGAGRLDDLAPPAPPKQKRTPQTVSFADFDQSIPVGFQTPEIRTPSAQPQHLTGILRTSSPARPGSDLNKPLPPPPQATAEPRPPVVPAKDSRPELSSPVIHPEIDQISKKMPPPPPPSSRRQAGVSGRPSSISNTSNQDSPVSVVGPDSGSIAPNQAEPSSKESGAKSVPPPPPPSRKPHPVSQSTVESLSDSRSEPKVVPRPPPRRHPSKSGSSTTPSRRTSDDSTTGLPTQSNTAPSSGAAPPPPPPRRDRASKRVSIDGPPTSLPRRFSDEHYRGASFDSERSTSISSLQRVAERSETSDHAVTSPKADSNKDILADMAAFQAEIDALRAQGGKAT